MASLPHLKALFDQRDSEHETADACAGDDGVKLVRHAGTFGWS